MESQRLDMQELWNARRRPEDAVMPCDCCGIMPAVRGVDGIRRCQTCFNIQRRLDNDFWSN